jgi:hypothetical protein
MLLSTGLCYGAAVTMERAGLSVWVASVSFVIALAAATFGGQAEFRRTVLSLARLRA